MKVTLTSTTAVTEFEIDGALVRARLWEGQTAKGVPVVAWIPLLAAERSEDLAEFEADLAEQQPPSAVAAAYPPRVTLSRDGGPAEVGRGANVDAVIAFLRARVDEDEQRAQAAQDGDGYAEWDNPSTGVVQVAGGDLDGLVLAPRNAAIHMARHDPARELREVETRRRILDEFEQLHNNPERLTDAPLHLAWNILRRVVLCHALPYAGHEDYRPEWRV